MNEKSTNNYIEESISELERLKARGLDIKKIIGRKTIQNIFKKVTEEQLERLTELGISLEKKSTVQKFIEELEQLQEIGVDVSKIQVIDSIGTLAKKSGIEEEKIKEVGLNSSENIGKRKAHIAQAYRGNGTVIPPTDEQVKRLTRLGISLNKKERNKEINRERINVTQRFIEKLEKLQEIGVDVSKIQQKDTIGTLAKKSGIEEEKIKGIGLNPSENIGSRKVNIAQAYRGNGTVIPPTEKQLERLTELGISLNKKEIKKEIKKERINVTQKFIEELEKLQNIGVDVSKIQKKDTIGTLAKKSGIEEKRIKEIGLNPSENIGSKRANIAQAYRGNETVIPPTEEQVKRLTRLGIRLERINVTQKFIEELEKLQEMGVDVSKIVFSDTIETLAKKSGIEEEKIKEAGLNLSENIGSRKNYIAQAYRGNGTVIPPTEKQLEKLKELGIDLERKNAVNIVQKFIEELEQLQEIGVDVSKIKVIDSIETLAKKSGIEEEKIKEVGLNLSENIGIRKAHIAQAYRGNGIVIPPTKEQLEKLTELGISLEKKNTVQEFIEKLEKLQEIGVDVSKIKRTDTIGTLAKKSGIEEEKIKK